MASLLRLKMVVIQTAKLIPATVPDEGRALRPDLLGADEKLGRIEQRTYGLDRIEYEVELLQDVGETGVEAKQAARAIGQHSHNGLLGRFADGFVGLRVRPGCLRRAFVCAKHEESNENRREDRAM